MVRRIHESRARAAQFQPIAPERRGGARTQPAASDRRAEASSVARAHAAAELGRAAEAIAAHFLQSQGLEVLMRNFRRRLGEIDLVARDGPVLVIVEVRTRSSDRYGGAAASVDWRKRARIVRAAHQLLIKRAAYAQMRIRFDVILVFNALAENPQVHWIKHAFAAC